MADSGDNLGLYVSVPFCRAKCSFCNFASGVSSAEAIDRYVAQLCREIQTAQTAATEVGFTLPERVETVYFGGGTPSLLEATQLKRIFGAIRAEFQVTADAEITMEAAPGQIGDRLLEAALACGVNRVSLGVQSFVDRESQAVGRSHTGADCRSEFARLRAAGVANLGADLIAGLPYQNFNSWKFSLEEAVAAGIEHVSVYMLEVDDESRLGREVLGGGARLHAPAIPSEDLIADLYEEACEYLPTQGLEQYEISNFGRTGFRSGHNQRYWNRASYLGVGLDAHSMLRGVSGDALRWANPDELTAYDGRSGLGTGQRLTELEAFEETIFLGLRLVEGLQWTELGRYPSPWRESLRHRVEPLRSAGMMDFDSRSLWLTAKGRLISGEIFGELLAGSARDAVAA